MNKYFNYWQSTIGLNDRDSVFLNLLKNFNNKPLKILEIGASRRLDIEGNNPAKAGDGWSTLFWCDYIQKNGGKLVIVDIEAAVIKNCKDIISDFLTAIDVQLNIGNGLDFISNEFDLIYLDGSDSFIECLNQFEKIDRSKTTILLDDFHKKGLLVRNKYKDFELIQVNNEHQMAIYYAKPSIIEVDTDASVINMASETGQILCSKRNDKNIVQISFYGENRDQEVLSWHQKVFQKFRNPINYIKCNFPQVSHGMAINHAIQNTAEFADYWIFWDIDAIPLFPQYLDFIYEKIRDNFTVFGVAQQSNHKNGPNGTLNHPYCSAAIHGISKALFIQLGCPTYGDEIPRSDTGEEITYQAEEKGFGTYIVWPKSVVGLTDEECSTYNIDLNHKFSDLGNGMKFGLGTNYGNLFYHQMCQNIPRSKNMFINICKDVLRKI